jgi:hypothetical protein
MVNCLHWTCSRFIARLRRNSFAINATVFVLKPLGQASIRVVEQDFQTQGHINEVISGQS